MDCQTDAHARLGRMTMALPQIRSSMVLAAVLAIVPAPARAAPLTVHGSSTFNTSVMVPYEREIEDGSGHALKVIPTKSSLGLVALLEGRADLAMLSTGLEREIEHLRETRPELPYGRLRAFLISKVRVAFAVNPHIAVRSATMTQIRQVLQGEIHNWRDLGGPEMPIQVVSVADGGGVTRTVETALFQGRPLAPRHPVQVQFGAMVAKIVQSKTGAFGVAQLAEVRRYKLPELKTDRAIEQELYLVTLDEPSEATGKVIAATRRVVFGED
jgi:phosphate transport system substrate-binding protein